MSQSDSSRRLTVLAIDEVEPLGVVDVTAAPRAWVRRRLPWLVVAAALAVLALVGAQTLVDTRERDRLAYLAGVPGVLLPLPQHVAALWHWTPANSVALVADDTAGRWIIGTRYGPGAVELRGTDPDTGALRWSTPFRYDDALPPASRDTFPSVWVRCATAAAPPQARAVCGGDLSGTAHVAGTPLMVLNPTDGAVLARQVLPAGTLWAVSAGRLVVAHPVADGADHTHWEVRATDPQTGALAWQVRTASVPVTRPGGLGPDGEATLSSDADRILLAGRGHAWLWSPEGSPQGTVPVGADGSTELGRSGTLVWTPVQSLAVPAGVLVTRRGTQIAVDGAQAQLTVDDGSANGVVLLRAGPGGTTVVAHDARTGNELWRTDGRTGPLLVLDGAVVAAGTSSVTSRDARTGEVRWDVRLDANPVYLGADPLHVVVLTDDAQLHSLDLVDGRTAGTTSLQSMPGPGAGNLEDAHEDGGRLVATFQDGSRLAVG